MNDRDRRRRDFALTGLPRLALGLVVVGFVALVVSCLPSAAAAIGFRHA